MATERGSVGFAGDKLVGNIARTILFATPMGASRYISFPSPISPIPVTIQVLVVFLADIFLGLVWDGSSIALCFAISGLGAPVFTGGSAGLAPLVGPIAGYLWLYPVTTVVVGLVVHDGISTGDYRMGTLRLVGMVVAGIVVVYASGALGFTYINRVSLESAFQTASAAFIPAEALKIAAAIGIVHPNAIAAQQTTHVEGPVRRYDDTVTVNRVDLVIDNGGCVVVAGANGSGKTTLVRHFNGLLDPDEGTVSVNGRIVSNHLVATRAAVAVVFQHPEDQLVATTVGADMAFSPENLGLDRGDIDRRVRESLAAVSLDGRGDEYIDSLSSGEVERLAIAGALTMRPDHLVLDEPFTDLDEPTRRSVLARFRDLYVEGTSLVIVTRNPRDVAKLADHVVVLADGDVALDAAPDKAADRLPDLDVHPPC